MPVALTNKVLGGVRGLYFVPEASLRFEVGKGTSRFCLLSWAFSSSQVRSQLISAPKSCLDKTSGRGKPLDWGHRFGAGSMASSLDDLGKAKTSSMSPSVKWSS